MIVPVAAYLVTTHLQRSVYGLTILLLLTACSDKSQSPTDPFEMWRVVSKIRHSDVPRALKLAEQGTVAATTKAESKWSWRLRFLYAELLLDQLPSSDNKTQTKISALLQHSVPPGVSPEEAEARRDSLLGYSAQRRSDWEAAKNLYNRALLHSSAINSDPCWTAELLVHHQAWTLRELKEFNSIDTPLKQAAPYAAACGDKYWHALILYVEANVHNDRFNYESAVTASQRCHNLAAANNLPTLIGSSLGVMALAYSNLGDTDGALAAFEQTDKYYKSRATQLSPGERRAWGVAIGHKARAYLMLKDYPRAKTAFREAIQMVEQSDDKAFATRFRAELASAYLETPDFDPAASLNSQVRQALQDPKLSKEFPITALAGLNEARFARLNKNFPSAETELEELTHKIAQNQLSPDPKIMWQIHGERAQLFSAMNRVQDARREFQTAVDISHSAQAAVKSDEYRLTYFSQLADVYQNYVHFLVEHNQDIAALREAQLGRAQLLADKLGIRNTGVSQFDFTQVARAKNATIFSYSIATENSYLWLTNAHSSQRFTLPKEAHFQTLETLIKGHNAQISKTFRIDQDFGGHELYKALIPEKAAALVPPNSYVIIIPDGPLSSLNFETLIPPGAPAHYWIESVVVSVAPSLTLLRAQQQRAISPPSILLVGDTVQNDPTFPPLGPDNINDIHNLYPSKCTTLTRNAATPSAFLQARPQSFSWIFLSTHAVSFTQSPLDSYIVLSPEANDGEYKLPARALANLKLKANLVTLSSCQSAGAKTVPGEGLVGLAWAVLSAGAQNVVASLWPVDARPTSQLMRTFYSHLHAGEPPTQALHSAKTAMVRAGAVPYQWAAFQLYSL